MSSMIMSLTTYPYWLKQQSDQNEQSWLLRGDEVQLQKQEIYGLFYFLPFFSSDEVDDTEIIASDGWRAMNLTRKAFFYPCPRDNINT